MRTLVLLPILAALLLPLASALPVAAQPVVADDSYADVQARELVQRARERREVVDTRITAYDVRVQERISARLGAAGLEKLLFRRETAAQIHWTRDTVRIEVLGAREVQPIASAGVRRTPPNLPQAMPSLAFDPVDSEMLMRLDSMDLRHPLAPGSEAFYRFASGDTTTIRLPSGHSVRLLELRIMARRPDPQLINGSFWLDAETYAVVRAGFRLSGRLSSSSETRVSVLMPEATAEVDYVAIDYGLYDMRWWLPRTVAARVVGNVAGIRVPIAYERRYDGYRVEGDTSVAVPGFGMQQSEAARPCRPRSSVTIGIHLEGRPNDSPVRDSVWDANWEKSVARVAGRDTTPEPDDDTVVRAGGGAGQGSACDRVFLVSRPDGVDLRATAALPVDIFDEDEGPISEAELSQLAALLNRIPPNRWNLTQPSLRLLTPELVRANRVEGLSLGASMALGLGPAELRSELRFGTTGEVGARLAGIYFRPGLRTEVAAYRGLQAVDIGSQPFALTSSISALLFGREENDYFRGTGVELRFTPAAARPQHWDVRMFAERQQPVSARSNLNLRALVDDFVVRPNREAEEIDQAGVTLRLRSAFGNDPRRLRTRAELELHGETGDQSFVRPMLRLSGDRALGTRLRVGLGLTAGTALGEVPVQRLWQIGGVGSVRGHDPAASRGESLLLTRSELTWGSPGLRLSLFGDSGWAGSRSAIGDSRPLYGGGVGAALFDNLVRLDLARGAGDGGGYRLYLRFGGGM
ncbi:hypothetical protein BH23GEM6_BH23GEM6_27920 [soil metagenome]